MNLKEYYHVTSEGLQKIPSLKEAVAKLNSETYVWFDYIDADRNDLSELIEPLGIHPLSIEDCTDENQVPKMDDFSTYSFLVFNAIYYKDTSLITDEVDIFIGKNFIVTVSGYSENSLMPLIGVRGVVERNIQGITQGPAWMLHKILDHVVDQMADAIDGLETEIDMAEEAILEAPATFLPSKLLYLRRNLLSLRKILFHEREVLTRISRNECDWIPKKTTIHYRDIYDHLSNYLEMTESYRDNVNSLMELYASMLNNKMARDSNQTNASVRRLTLITTVFMPLTLLAGIFGMSEWSMMTGTENWRKAYPYFGVIMIIIGSVNYFFIKWMEKRDIKRLSQSPENMQ